MTSAITIPSVTWWVLPLVLAVPAAMLLLEHGLIRDYQARLFHRLFILAYVTFSGIGALYLTGDRALYLGYYAGYGLAYSLSFTVLWRQLERRLPARFRPSDELPVLFKGWGWRTAMALYLLVMLVLLVYPENKLMKVVVPPPLNILATWNEGLGVVPSRPEKYLSYLVLLLLPVYYYALGVARWRWPVKAALVVLPAYLEYCRTGYLGRSEIMLVAAVVAIPFWLQRPAWRRWLLLATVVALPFLLAAAYLFQCQRLGKSTDARLSWTDQAVTILYQQTQFPQNFPAVYRHGPRGRWGEVAAWLVTLPIPSVWCDKPSVRLNHELTAIVTGRVPGDQWYFVCLTGLVAESYYLLGPLFFLHAALLAGFSVFLLYLYSGGAKLHYVWAFIAFIMSYSVNRAGIAGCLPVMINNLLVLNVLLVTGVVLNAVRGSPVAARPLV